VIELKELVTVAELAERLRVHVKTVYRWIEQGKIEITRVGTRAIRFNETQIARFLRVRKK